MLAIGVSVLVYRRWGNRQLKFLLKMAGGIVPRTPRERRLFPVVCVTAGVTEEVIYRWFMLSYLMVLLDLGVWQSVALSSALFGLAHFYQGIRGVLLTGILGAAFASIWFSTGTLLAPIILHTLVDLRISLILTSERIHRLESSHPSGAS